MSFSFAEYTIDIPGGFRSAMVITPNEHIVVPADSGPQPGSAAGTLSEIDRRILEEAHASARRSSASVCIFRGACPDDGGSYRFDPSLDESGATALAARMLEGQLQVYRAMLHLGICLFLHVDLGPLEVAGFRTAATRASDRIATFLATTEGEHPAKQVDLWLLRNLSFYFTLTFDKLVATLLPEKLALMEKRMERIQRLVATLPQPEF